MLQSETLVTYHDMLATKKECRAWQLHQNFQCNFKAVFFFAFAELSSIVVWVSLPFFLFIFCRFRKIGKIKIASVETSWLN